MAGIALQPGTLPTGTGSSRICAVTCWRAYKTVVEELTGAPLDPGEFAFRRLHSSGTTLVSGDITTEAIGDVITRCGEIAGLGIGPTGHSTCHGLANTAKKAGNERGTGWLGAEQPCHGGLLRRGGRLAGERPPRRRIPDTAPADCVTTFFDAFRRAGLRPWPPLRQGLPVPYAA